MTHREEGDLPCVGAMFRVCAPLPSGEQSPRWLYRSAPGRSWTSVAPRQGLPVVALVLVAKLHRVNHQQVSGFQLDGADLEGHSIPIIAEEHHRVPFLLEALERQPAVVNDIGSPFTRNLVLASGPRKLERHEVIPW